MGDWGDTRTFYKQYVDAVSAHVTQMCRAGKELSDASLRLVTDAHVTAKKHDLEFYHDSCVCTDAPSVARLMRRAFDADERHNATQFMNDTGMFILETHLRPLVAGEQEWRRVASDTIHAAFAVVHAHNAQRVFDARFSSPLALPSAADTPLPPRVRRSSPRKPHVRKRRVKQGEVPPVAAD